jgi:hypothetical protein
VGRRRGWLAGRRAGTVGPPAPARPDQPGEGAVLEDVSYLLAGVKGQGASPAQCQLGIALALAQTAEALAQPAADGAALVRAIAR